MGNRGGFEAPVSNVSYEVASEHRRKYVCRACGQSSTTLVNGECWRHRPADPATAPRERPVPRGEL